jgi:hypothetical protein
MPLFQIKYRTRISGLAKRAYEDQYAYIEASSNREANKAFKAGIRFDGYGGRSIMRHELGPWYNAQPCAVADIIPEPRWTTDFPRRPLTVKEVSDLIAQDEAVMRAAYPDLVRMTLAEANKPRA